MRAQVIGAIVTATGLLAVSAHAEEAPTPRLRLEVDAECTNSADFAARVRARSSRIHSSEGEDATLVSVAIAPAAAGERVAGTMRIGDSVRQVEGGSCEEVADALSLITALTLDPEAGAPAPSMPAPALPAAPEQPPPVQSPLGPPPVRAQEGWRFGVGLHGVAAAMSELPIGVSLAGEMARGQGLSALALRLALTSYRATVELGTRASNLVWFFLVPHVCPLRVRAGPLSVFPCAGVGMGVLASEPTRGVVRPNKYRRAWIAPRVALRARVAVTARIGVELEAALDVPVTRDRYAFGPVEAFRVPLLMPAVGVGIAVELP